MKYLLRVAAALLMLSCLAFAADIFERGDEIQTERVGNVNGDIKLFEDISLNQEIELKNLGIISFSNGKLSNNAALDIYFLNETNQPIKISRDYIHDVQIRYVRKGVEFTFKADVFQKSNGIYQELTPHEVKPLYEAFYQLRSEELPPVMIKGDEPIWMELYFGDNKFTYNMKSQQTSGSSLRLNNDYITSDSEISVNVNFKSYNYITSSSYYNPSAKKLYLYPKSKSITLEEAMQDISVDVLAGNTSISGTWSSKKNVGTSVSDHYTCTFTPSYGMYSPVRLTIIYFK